LGQIAKTSQPVSAKPIAKRAEFAHQLVSASKTRTFEGPDALI
jgi:hypothetical protein